MVINGMLSVHFYSSKLFFVLSSIISYILIVFITYFYLEKVLIMRKVFLIILFFSFSFTQPPSFECSDLNQEDCEYLDFCEWISDSDNPNSWGSCVEIGDDNDGPPDCLDDCEGIEDINPNENPYEACDWIISTLSSDSIFSECTWDCDDEIMMEINEIVEACYECLQDVNFDCADVFDDGNEECEGVGFNDEGCCDFQSVTPCIDPFGNQLGIGDECDFDSLCEEPVTMLNFSIPQDTFITLSLTSECGDIITLIDNEPFSAGMYAYTIDSNEYNLATGCLYANIRRK